MSRPAKPAAVKEAQGNPGRRPIAKEGSGAHGAAFPVPRGLTGRAKALWLDLAPKLSAQRLLRETDLGPFRRYVSLLAKWELAEALLKASPLVETTESAHVTMERTSKAMIVAIMLDKRLSEIEDRFGMNPSARQRLLMQMAAASSQGALALGGEPPAPGTPEPAAIGDGLPTSPVGLLN